ncbi:MAG: hypothetical protein JWP25_4678 [Bradyrhizobium sp.]|nr:hypothetical protein [Bradyrhizobium sp.]
MAEINNALALGVKPAEFDIIKPLAAAAQINSLRANTAQTEQETGYRQFQQDQNEGYRVPEVNTLAEAHQKQMGMAGQLGNMMVNDPSPAGVKQAIEAAKKSGIPIDPKTEQHLLSAPPQQIIQYGKNLQAAGQTSTANIEQSPGQVAKRAASTKVGEASGITGEEPPPLIPRARAPVPSSKAIMGDDEAVKKGLYSPTPDQIKRGVLGPPSDQPGDLTLRANEVQARAAERSNLAPRLAEEYTGIKQEAMNAASTKYLLRNLNDDAERFPTGKGANVAGAMKQWLQAAGQLPGVGAGIKKITGDYSDPVAAFEALQKNAGQLTRATLKDAEGKAASEYSMIQKQLPNAELSPRGLKLVVSQMTAPEDYKQAKLQAADKWRATHGGTIDGFASDWNKNIGPGAFLFGRLSPEEQTGLVDRLKKTPEGMNTLKSLRTQMHWAHENGLSSVLD